MSASTISMINERRSAVSRSLSVLKDGAAPRTASGWSKEQDARSCACCACCAMCACRMCRRLSIETIRMCLYIYISMHVSVCECAYPYIQIYYHMIVCASVGGSVRVCVRVCAFVYPWQMTSLTDVQQLLGKKP